MAAISKHGRQMCTFLGEKIIFFVISLVFFVRFRPSRYQNDQLIKTTITKLPQHPFSNLNKTTFPRLKMFIVHNPIQNKWFNNLNYLSKQILHNLLFSGRTNICIQEKLQDCLKLGQISNFETCKNLWNDFYVIILYTFWDLTSYIHV
jgi:hypothetical protein